MVGCVCISLSEMTAPFSVCRIKPPKYPVRTMAKFTCIIFQLKDGDNTDQKLLFELCAKYSKEKEFFIRKAIGWALRQYSKYNPKAVAGFIQKQKLSPLSVKEGSKYL